VRPGILQSIFNLWSNLWYLMMGGVGGGAEEEG